MSNVWFTWFATTVFGVLSIIYILDESYLIGVLYGLASLGFYMLLMKSVSNE
jgi:hypothetical protein